MMRTERQIQRAHDAVCMAIQQSPFRDGGSELALRACLDVLCWTLEHHHNDTFENSLNLVIDQLRAHGSTRLLQIEPGSRIPKRGKRRHKRQGRAVRRMAAMAALRRVKTCRKARKDQ